MRSQVIDRLAAELSSRGEAFVSATVVRVERPTSVQPGNVALVREDGTIEGFVGGVCAQHSVRLYSLRAIERGEPLLLRILGDADGETDGAGAADAGPTAGTEVSTAQGAVTVKNPCLSGGSIEVFLEPFLPAPRVIVAGESPIAQALHRLGPEVGLEVALARDDADRPRPPQATDLALVVAAHGRDELSALRAGLVAGVPYVGLVASPRRGAAVLQELRADGVEEALLARVDCPAGYDIGARSPSEIALSILAAIVEVRRRGQRAAQPPPRALKVETATDPICGMAVVVTAGTPRLERGGETAYFCCEGCLHRYEQQLTA